MNKNHWKVRFLLWYARRILRVPVIVNFTPEEMADIYAVGFAWSPEAAQRIRGDDRLIERLKAAEAKVAALSGTRRGRRIVNRAAQKAAGRVARDE